MLYLDNTEFFPSLVLRPYFGLNNKHLCTLWGENRKHRHKKYWALSTWRLILAQRRDGGLETSTSPSKKTFVRDVCLAGPREVRVSTQHSWRPLRALLPSLQRPTLAGRQRHHRDAAQVPKWVMEAGESNAGVGQTACRLIYKVDLAS